MDRKTENATNRHECRIVCAFTHSEWTQILTLWCLNGSRISCTVIRSCKKAYEEKAKIADILLAYCHAVEPRFGGYEYETVTPAIFTNKRPYCKDLS